MRKRILVLLLISLTLITFISARGLIVPDDLKEIYCRITGCTITGDLNVTGTIYNTLSSMHGLSTEIGTVDTINTWYNLTFNSSLGNISNLDLEDNRTIIIDHDGKYALIYGSGMQDTASLPISHIGFRITKNGEEIEGSYVEKDLDEKDLDTWMEHTTHAALEAGDKLNLQYISDKTTVTIYAKNTWATQPFNAYGYIQEVK